MELISKAKLYNEILKIENRLLETANNLATCTDAYKFDLINARLSTCSMLKHLVDDFELENDTINQSQFCETASDNTDYVLSYADGIYAVSDDRGSILCEFMRNLIADE